MDFWTLFWGLYVLSAGFAIIMSYREQKKNGPKTPVFLMTGYVCCIVWPIVAAIIVILQRLHRDVEEVS